MVEIISKRDGPRLQDLPQRKLIEKNRPVIRGLINKLTGGALSQSSAPQAEASQQNTKTIHIIDATPPREPGRAVVRISVNGRVVLMDDIHARQIMHLGDLRRTSQGDVFRLATKDNGFFAPVEAAIAEVLTDLDGQAISAQFTEDILAERIAERLSLGGEKYGE